MKILRCFLYCCLAVLILPIGCSDGKPNEPEDLETVEIPEVTPLPETYGSKLSAYWYSGYTASVEYISEEKATLIIEPGTLNLSSVENNPVSGEVAVPGIIPGVKNLSIDIALDSVKDDFWYRNDSRGIKASLPEQYKKGFRTYKGDGNTEGISYECHGILNPEYRKVTLMATFSSEISQTIEESWLLHKYEWNENENIVKSSPFYVTWNDSFESFGPLSTTAFVQILLNTPFIPANAYGLYGSDVRLISLGYLAQIISPVVDIHNNEISYNSIYTWLRNEAPEETLYQNSFPSNTFTFSMDSDNMLLCCYPNLW